MKNFIKASFLAPIGYLLTLAPLGLLSLLIPYPYFTLALALTATLSVLMFTIIFSTIFWQRFVVLIFIFLIAFITAYFPLGLPMADDPSTCRRLACSQLQKDLENSYYINRGVPLVWQGYATFPVISNQYIILAPYSDFGRYTQDWWSPAAYWPNLVKNSLIFASPSLLFYFLRLIFSKIKH